MSIDLKQYSNLILWIKNGVSIEKKPFKYLKIIKDFFLFPSGDD